MKQGWKIKKIRDICAKGSSNVVQNKIKGKTGDYPIYGASGYIQNVDFYHQDNEYIAVVKDGSGIGRVVMLPAKSSVIGTMQYILPYEGTDLRFLYYALQSLDLSKAKQGAAIPHIYFRDYGEYQISFPTEISEQRRIVEVLDREFERIDKIRRNAETSLQYAKDLMQAKLKEELQYKEGWDKTVFGKAFKLKSGEYLPTKDLTAGSYSVYGGNGIMGYHNKFNLEGVNIIVGRVGALCGTVRYLTEKIWITDNAFRLISLIPNAFDSKFLVYYLNLCNLRDYARQAAQPVISNSSLATIEINIPSLSEQQQIVFRLDQYSEICKKIEENSKAIITHCDALKQAFLRKAFDGEL